MRLITGPPPRRSAPGSRSQGRAAVSGCHLASGASAGAGPPPFGTPGSPRPDDRAVRVAPSGLRPSREQILPGLTRPPPATVAPAFLRQIWYFLLFSPVAGGAAAWPACRGRSWRSPVPRVPRTSRGLWKNRVSLLAPLRHVGRQEGRERKNGKPAERRAAAGPRWPGGGAGSARAARGPALARPRSC